MIRLQDFEFKAWPDSGNGWHAFTFRGLLIAMREGAEPRVLTSEGWTKCVVSTVDMVTDKPLLEIERVAIY